MTRMPKADIVMDKLLENTEKPAQMRIQILAKEIEKLTWGELFILTKAIETMIKKHTE